MDDVWWFIGGLFLLTTINSIAIRRIEVFLREITKVKEENDEQS